MTMEVHEPAPAAPAAPVAPPAAAPAGPLLGDAPVRRGAPSDPGAAPQGGEGEPAAPVEYEHDFLKTYAKGKYPKFDDFGKHVEGLHTEMKRMQTANDALQTRLGGWKGPPVGDDGKPRDYALKQTEESLKAYGPIDTSTEEFQFVNAWGKKWGCPEDAVNELMPLYEKIVGGNADGQADATRQILAEKYGSAEEAAAVVNDVWAWAEDRLGEDKRAVIKRVLLSSPDVAPLLEQLMKAQDQAPIPAGGSGGGAPSETHASMIAMKKEDPNWARDPAKAERWQRFCREQAARDEATPGKQTTTRPLAELQAEARGDARR